MASKNPWVGEEIDRAKRMYQEGHSVYDIGEVLNRSRDGVIRVLKAHGVKMRPRGAYSADDRLQCLSFQMMCEDAMIGSAQLLAAIERAGVRP